MPASTKVIHKSKKSKVSATKAQMDIVFAGPLLFVPATSGGNITGVEIFSPRNDHPIGAVFLPGVLFTDAELDAPTCERWPDPESFSLLDPHSYSIELEQKGKQRDFSTASIPDTNHKIKPGRRLSSDWDVAITIVGQISAWSSHRLVKVTEKLFHGADAPAPGEITASLHRLSYNGVTGADFYGASKESRDYLRTNISQGGTLIVIGEIPYQSSLLHERRAIDSIAKLAGLNLHLAETAPLPYRTRLMNHVIGCGHSIIVV
ncbi:hypothetical protein [Acidicapsa ligni]|uniref:hypothetical protein n=1 Tax=Acidicapsa ligni TaxID=542300 RepID=UPI0021E0CDD3|nr:hypothetical protein [Acidicapsa ligni]